jgi:hypothetical protein
MTTALQKPWMKDLPPPVVEFAKKQAVKATEAWNDTVEGILNAAKAIYEVREKIGGKGDGTFSGWAEEELKRSNQTASQLATIGERYAEFHNVSGNLPPSWGTLYELAKADDKVFRVAHRRVRPEMTRTDVQSLVAEVWEDFAPPPTPTPKRPPQKATTSGARAAPRTTPASAIPVDAAKQLTVHWKSLLQEARDVFHDTKRDRGALSPEAKAFLIHNYIEPLERVLRETKEVLK